MKPRRRAGPPLKSAVVMTLGNMRELGVCGCS
jgi:hypothetical protein